MANTFRAITSDSFDTTRPHSAMRRLFVESLYRQYGAVLTVFAARIVHDGDAAEDIVQEAFTSILAGRFPVPALDVRRKLEIVVRFHCEEHKDARARLRIAKARMRASRDTRERVWRSWRVTPLRFKDRDEWERERAWVLDERVDG
jgi:hypothetical protein